jgi:hypothetical protein
MWMTFLSATVDLVSICIVASVYFRRHQRRDLMLAYVALNSGVFAVTAMLASAPVGAGLGLGLFGILSIIRLRSDSITQEEIAYYFIALALGLVTGLHPGTVYEVAGLATVLILVMLIADHQGLFPSARHLLLTVDAAIPDEGELWRHVEQRLHCEVRKLTVQQLDFVRDITLVDVRFRRPRQSRQLEPAPVAQRPAADTGAPSRIFRIPSGASARVRSHPMEDLPREPGASTEPAPL